MLGELQFCSNISMRVNFEWDPAKAASNLRKHGVSFELALRVFADPFALMARDRIEGGRIALADGGDGRRSSSAAGGPHASRRR